MFNLIRSRLLDPRLYLDISRVPSSPATVTTARPTAPTQGTAAAAPVAPAPQPEGGQVIRDRFTTNVPPKPVQQATLLNPITVAKLSFAGAKEMPKELVSNVATHVKDTQKKVASLVPKQTEAAKPKKGKGGKGGGRRGKGGGQLFDEGSDS